MKNQTNQTQQQPALTISISPIDTMQPSINLMGQQMPDTVVISDIEEEEGSEIPEAESVSEIPEAKVIWMSPQPSAPPLLEIFKESINGP